MTDSRLVVRTRHVVGAPVAAVRIWFPLGARAEGRPGQGMLTGRMLAEGTTRRDFRAIASAAEDRGASIHPFGGFEVYGLSIDALAADWERALGWAAELVFESSFPMERAAWTAKQMESELESLGDEPETLTSWAFLDQLYAPHPRRLPAIGTIESLRSLTADDCQKHHARGLAAGAIVTVAGAIDEDLVAARARELFGDFAGVVARPPEPPAPSRNAAPHKKIETDAEDQAHLYLGQLTVPRGHADYAALEVVGIALGAGAGLSGRIPLRIREKEGLAYTAYAQTVAGSGLDPGRLLVYVGTSPATVEKAENSAREEIARLVADGLTEEEVAEARAYLLGRDPFQRETARQWSEILAESELYGLALDDPQERTRSLLEVDLARANAAIREHIHPDRLFATVGLPRADD